MKFKFLLISLLGFLVACTSTHIDSKPDTHPFLESAAQSKKLIDLSVQVMPTPAILKANASSMKNRGYAGAVVKLSHSYMQVFVAGEDPDKVHQESDFVQDFKDLAYLKQQGILSDNFLAIYAAKEASWDWFDEDDWAITTSNLSLYARAAKAGGFKGLMFDPEPYGLSPWYYQTQQYPGKSFKTVYTKVRQRGKQFIEAVQKELPNAQFLSLYLMEPILGEWDKYELWKPFVEGMLEGAAPTIRFIEGNEPSYYYLSATDFDQGKTELRNAYRALDPSLSSKYKKQVRIAHAAYVDGVLNLYESPHFFGFYLSNDNQRKRLLQHNLYHGLRSSDEYVWVYGESMNIYRNADPYVMPSGLIWANRSAVSKIANGEPLGYTVEHFVNPAKLEYDRQVIVYGTIRSHTSLSEVRLVSNLLDSKGQDAACYIYDAYGNFKCAFPYGWTGTIKAISPGFSFSPAVRRYNNLTDSIDGQDFVTR